MFLLFGGLAIIVAGSLITLQLIKCQHCPYKEICKDMLEDGQNAPCRDENNNNNIQYAI